MLLSTEESNDRSVVSDSATPWTIAHQARFLCPWNSPGMNTGVGCHFVLQGIFLTQGPKPYLLYWQADSSPLSHLESLRKADLYSTKYWATAAPNNAFELIRKKKGYSFIKILYFHLPKCCCNTWIFLGKKNSLLPSA